MMAGLMICFLVADALGVALLLMRAKKSRRILKLLDRYEGLCAEIAEAGAKGNVRPEELLKKLPRCREVDAAIARYCEEYPRKETLATCLLKAAKYLEYDILFREIKSASTDPEASIEFFTDLLPRCATLDAEIGKIDKTMQSLVKWVDAIVVWKRLRRLVDEHNLMCGKIHELFDDPAMTSAKWRELLPACELLDWGKEELEITQPETCGHLDLTNKKYRLALLVHKIIDPDYKEET